MTSFLVFMVGLIIGASVGVVVAALCFVARYN